MFNGWNKTRKRAFLLTRLIEYEIRSHYSFIDDQLVDKIIVKILEIRSTIENNTYLDPKEQLKIMKDIEIIMKRFKFWDGNHYLIHLVYFLGEEIKDHLSTT